MPTQQIRGGGTNSQVKADTITNTEINSAAAIASSKLATWGGDRNAGSHKLTNLADGTASTDAVNKGQLDAARQGINAKRSARFYRAAALPAYTQTSPTVLTANANGAFPTTDDIAPAVNDYILVNGDTLDNGLYKLTTLGDGSNPWVLTRSDDMDTAAEVPGAYVFIEAGTTYASSGWIVSAPTQDDAFTLGTDTITFVQFTGAAAVIAGAGLTKTVNTLDVVAGDTSITVNADELHVNLADSTLAVSSGLKVASNGITATQLNTSVAGGGISGGGGTALAVDFVREVPTGTVNGSNTDFVLSSTPAPAGNEMVFVNGLLQLPTTHYSISGATITFVAGAIPQTGDNILVWYLK